MGDLIPIIVAIVTSVGTVGAAYFGARRLSNARRTDAPKNAARWREQADLEKARADLLAEQLDDERTARITAEGRLATTQHDLDDCARQRDDAFSELRAAGRRRPAPRVGS